MRVLAAVDHFGPGYPASEVARALSLGAHLAGATCTTLPLASGGNGTLAVLGGPTRRTRVMGPLGNAIEVPWRLRSGTAVVEAALASGLHLVGGPTGNDAIAAGTHGTGELILAAAEAGAKRIIVAPGGTASTDGGLGALRAIFPANRLKGVRVLVACDVETGYLDAAHMYAPAKGATTAEVRLLQRRLERLAQVHLDQHGVDVRALTGAGSGGGLAGGLAALGATLCRGFDVIADETNLATHIEDADLVITGEAVIDDESLRWGVVGGVRDMAERAGTPCIAFACDVFDDAERKVPVALVDATDLLSNLTEAVRRTLKASWLSS